MHSFPYNTYEVVVVFQVASNRHLTGTVASRHIPFAPVVCVYTPGREVIAVGGDLVLVADHGVAVAHALLVHARVCAGSDVGQAQRRLAGGARRSRRVVLLGRRAGGVLGLLGRVGEGNVFLVGAQASWTRARVGMRGMRRVLRLTERVGARGQRVLLGVARDLGRGRRGGRGIRRACGRWTLLRRLRGAACRLQAAGDRGGAVLAAVGGALVNVDVGRGAIVVGRVVQLLLLARRRGRHRAGLPHGRRNVQLLGRAPAMSRRPSRRLVRRVGGRRCARGECLGRRLQIGAAARHECVGACTCGALGGSAQIPAGCSYAWTAQVLSVWLSNLQRLRTP